MSKKGLLERLRDGVVIGDGGMVIALEKRGYVEGGSWSTEAAVEHPEAVKQIHREWVRAGSDVLQTFTFYSSDDKLALADKNVRSNFTCRKINEAACRIAQEVARESDTLVAGGITRCPYYTDGKGKDAVQAQIRKQLEVFVENKVDFIIAEFIFHVEEMEWAIEEALKTGLPLAATMAINEEGDFAGISVGECAVRMAKAGAHVVGVNCLFDPESTVKTIKAMKVALDAAGLSPYLMTQPNGFLCPKVGQYGYLSCREFPYAMEPRQVTRFDVHHYARQVYNLGVRYIGGCCGFEPYHIRAIAEELAQERGKLPPASQKNKPWGKSLELSEYSFIKKRVGREYWMNMVPSSGRVNTLAEYDPRPEDDKRS